MLFQQLKLALSRPQLPLGHEQRESDDLRDVVAQTSHGNLSLQAGEFYFSEDTARELDDLEGWSFSAGKRK